MIENILLDINVRDFYDRALIWLTTVGPRILFAVVVLIIGEWIIKLVRKAVHNGMNRKNVDPSLRPFLRSTIATALQVLLILAVIQIIGFQMTVFTALIGAFGVAAGLALSGTLQNFTSGIVILLLKPYRVSDAIMAQGQEGIVTSIQIFYTVLTTYDNKTVIIPNSKLSNELIVNLSREGRRRLDIELKFNYSFSFETVKAIVEKTIKKFKTVLDDPPVRIGVSSMEDSGYKIVINIWVPAHGFQDFKMQLQQQLIEDLKASELKLPGM